MGKPIGGEKTVISTIEIGLSYKIFFVLGMLHILRGHNSARAAECKEILVGVRKILISMAVEDSELEPEVVDEPDQGQKLLLNWCHRKKRFSHGPQKLNSSLLRPL